MKPLNFLSNLFKHLKFRSKKKKSEQADLEKIAAKERKKFSFETLSKATDNFHPSHKLGQGGFGPVYKGKLFDGRQVAVKMLSQYSRQGNREFENEAKLLSSVQHRNVVNLLGYCAYEQDKLLVYEYIANESLDKILFKPERCKELDWKRRYNIIAGVAKGMQYLHEDSHTCIIHRDIKASNILVDDNWVPKIADFGMARLFPEDQTHVNTRVAGTNGYMAPEYVMHGHLSVKTDVFNFGVVMLELITGRRNSSHNSDLKGQNLLEWAYKQYKKGRSLEILDPTVASTSVDEQVSLCVQTALLCTQSNPSLRPTMRRVVVLLSRKPTNLEEPTKPGFAGFSQRKSGHRGASSPRTASSAASSSSKSEFSTSTGMSTTVTRPTTPPTLSHGSHSRGKQVLEIS